METKLELGNGFWFFLAVIVIGGLMIRYENTDFFKRVVGAKNMIDV